jgi:hypothetical protein
MVELIITMGIVTLLAGVVLRGFSGQRSATFNDAFERIISRLPTIRAMSLNSSVFDDVDGDGEDEEPHAYGLYIGKFGVASFADLEDLEGETMNIFDPGDILLNDSEEIPEEYELSIEAGGVSYDGVSLLYLAPRGDMLIQVENGRGQDGALAGVDAKELTQYNPVTVTLRTPDGVLEKSFVINKISGIAEPTR